MGVRSPSTSTSTVSLPGAHTRSIVMRQPCPDTGRVNARRRGSHADEQGDRLGVEQLGQAHAPGRVAPVSASVQVPSGRTTASSPQPSRCTSSARVGATVTTVPERANATARGPASSGSYVASARKCSGCSRRSRRAVAVTRSFAGPTPGRRARYGAAPSRRPAGCRGRRATGRAARCPGRRRPRPASSAAPASARAAWTPTRGAGARRRPPRSATTAASATTPRTNASTASSNAGTGSTQDVRSLASRVAFSTYATARSAVSGHAPSSVCHTSSSVARSGPAVERCRAPRADQRTTVSPHSVGHCASSTRRARTSSLRLVSCVDSVVCETGQSRCATAHASWNSSTGRPKRPGSPPTSLSAARRR